MRLGLGLGPHRAAVGVGGGGVVTSLESGLVTLLAASPSLPTWLASYERAQASIVDVNGAIGANQGGLQAVSLQRDALWLAVRGLVEADTDLLDAAVLALEWGFDQQHASGYFNNGLGYSSTDGALLDDNAFFVECFVRVRNMIAGSAYAATYASNFAAMEATLGDALAWLDTYQTTLATNNDTAGNRIFKDAAAFTLGGLILNDSTAIANGETFLGYGYGLQDVAGWIEENTGYDSSYQGVSLLRMAEAALGMPAGTERTALLAAMQDAADWELTRITNGEVSADGNTRTGPDSPEGKEINHYEVALGLFLAGYVLDDATVLAAAEDVSAWILLPRLTATLVDATARSGSTSVASVPIGTAATERRVVMALAVNNASPSITIGGIAATVHVTSAYSSPLTGYYFYLVSALVPTGTTATVAISAGTGIIVSGVWSITGAESEAFDTLSTGWNTTATGAIDMAAKGCVIGHAGGIESTTLTFAWTGLSEVFDEVVTGGGQNVSGAGLNQVSAQTGRTITATGTGGAGYTHMGVASFRKPPA